MTAFYNEIDPYAAQWLRNLIAAGHIAPGIVDERSIQDIAPDELSEFTQCHFFAGIGGWPLALRRAGWPDDRPVWTGSCPCQPFSAAGAGAGFADPRHLWPDFSWLIANGRPTVVFGEQVATKVVDAWIDLVQADLEALGYAVGSISFPSAGVGAPHIRDRNYWVADTNDECQEPPGFASGARHLGGGGAAPGWLDDSYDSGPQGLARDGGSARGQGPERPVTAASLLSCGLGDPHGDGSHRTQRASAEPSGNGAHGRVSVGGGGDPFSSGSAGPTNGLWADADWLYCRDNKWRAVEPGTSPLADGVPSRVGRLRAYGNAINVEAARCFIASYLDGLTHSS